MEKFTFVKYKGKVIVLLDNIWATGWITKEITKTGLLRSVDHYVFEQDISEVIESKVYIKDKELEKMKIYYSDFVNYYTILK